MYNNYLTTGSPPHTRGKELRDRIRRGTAGITPAHAGKSLQKVTRHICNKDHPRTRGEKEFSEYTKYDIEGSPPHTRGKVTAVFVFSVFARITPAHAGKRAP